MIYANQLQEATDRRCQEMADYALMDLEDNIRQVVDNGEYEAVIGLLPKYVPYWPEIKRRLKKTGFKVGILLPIWSSWDSYGSATHRFYLSWKKSWLDKLIDWITNG